VLAGLLAVSVPGAVPSPRLRTVHAYVDALAMDGPLVAYGDSTESSAQPCKGQRTLVWDLRTGHDSVVSGQGTCEAGSSAFGRGVIEVAIAGSQVAWIVRESGSDEAYDSLYTGSLTGGGERKLAEGPRFGTPTETPGGSSYGTWIWRLKGGGSLIVAEFLQMQGKTVVADSLRRVTPTGLAPLVGGTAGIVDFDVDAGRVAVLRGGSATIYSQGGSLLRTIPAPAGYALALDGASLVVARPGKLDVYDAASGALLHTWPVPAGPGQGARTPVLDAAAGIAAFDDYDKLYAVDLANGRERQIGSGGDGGVNGLAIDSLGLAYTFGLDSNRLGFIPLAAVKAAVG
jgi:hypothetical protein